VGSGLFLLGEYIMGWYGTFCNNNLKSIKRALEDGLTRTHENGTKQTLLYHSFKFIAFI
jgi:hypothetical protein